MRTVLDKLGLLNEKFQITDCPILNSLFGEVYYIHIYYRTVCLCDSQVPGSHIQGPIWHPFIFQNIKERALQPRI